MRALVIAGAAVLALAGCTTAAERHAQQQARQQAYLQEAARHWQGQTIHDFLSFNPDFRAVDFYDAGSQRVYTYETPPEYVTTHVPAWQPSGGMHYNNPAMGAAAANLAWTFAAPAVSRTNVLVCTAVVTASRIREEHAPSSWRIDSMRFRGAC